MNIMMKNKFFKLIYIMFCILAFVTLGIGCSKKLKIVEFTSTNVLDNQNGIINILKNKKCAYEHKEDVREVDFDSVYFGRYEQDGIVKNGKEDIEWIIVDKDFENNEVLLISKYLIDYIDFGKDFKDLSIYFKYFYEQAFDDNEKKFLLDNNQTISGKEYSKKIMLPTKEILSKSFKNDFQRELYGTSKCIDERNMRSGYQNLSSINNNFSYIYVDDLGELRRMVGGTLSDDEQYLIVIDDIGIIGISPMIRVAINNLIKNYSYDNEMTYTNSNKDNKNISNFILENNIELDGIYSLYKEPLFNIYTELKNHINHNRDTGEYGVLYHNYYEITYEDGKKTIELSYKLVDMDNDNCKELVIFNEDRVLELYTIYKNTLRHLYSSERGSPLREETETNSYFTKDNKLLTYYWDPFLTYYNSYILNKGNLYEESSYHWDNDWINDYDLYECKDYMHNKVYMMNINDVKNRVRNNKEGEIVINIPYDYKEGIKLARIAIDPNNEYLFDGWFVDYSIYDYDTVIFGKYYNYDDKKTNLEWIVLDKNEDKALLLSKNVIDCKCFEDTKTETTYNNSSIRKWLNEEFYNEAFSDSEKMNIIETKNINIDLQGNRGEDTIDKVFLLSLDEVEKYFGELDNIDENNSYERIVHNNRAQAFPTQYAKKTDNFGEKLFYSKEEGKDYFGACEWWLRTMNSDNKSTAIVYCNGYAEGLEKKHLINYKNRGVRPALWVQCIK